MPNPLGDDLHWYSGRRTARRVSFVSEVVCSRSISALDLPADSGQRMLVYTAEPGSPSHDAMQLLASWASTPAAAAATTTDDDDR